MKTGKNDLQTYDTNNETRVTVVRRAQNAFSKHLAREHRQKLNESN